MPILFMAFLWTVPGGAVLFTIVWLLTRRLSSHVTIWRFVLSSITALAVTPTTMNFCGQDYIVPAAFASLMVFAPDATRRSLGLIHGVLPLLAFAATILLIWSYSVQRQRKAT